jgi:sec-independent protein translocase protein TatB
VFNIGPLEFVVLIAVALIVFGPEKLPQLTKDAARMIRTLRDMAQGARSQLNSELGPEFANFDLNSLNPRTAIKNALLGDEDLSSLNPKEQLERALRGEDDPKPASANGASANGVSSNGASPSGATSPPPSPPPSAPLMRGEQPPFDPDTT